MGCGVPAPTARPPPPRAGIVLGEDFSTFQFTLNPTWLLPGGTKMAIVVENESAQMALAGFTQTPAT